MEYRPLHATGPKLSRIVAGAWRWNNVEGDAVDKLIHTAIDCGITSFDHADIYGDYSNEAIFGTALKKDPSIRKNIQLITKCGIQLMSEKYPGTWIKHYDTSRRHILSAAERSLVNLGTDYIDLLLIHRPDPLLDPQEVAEAFGLLKQSGKVLHFGVSNFTATQFEMLQSYLPFQLATNQIEISLSKPGALFDGTTDVLQKHRVSPMAWSPLGGGKLLTASSSLWSKREKYNASETQLSLAWLLNHPSGIFPIIGTTQSNRIIESAASANIQLDRQDWFEMLKVSTGKDVA